MSAVAAGHYDQPFFKEPPADAPRGPTGMLLSEHHLGDTAIEYAALQTLTAIAGRGSAVAPLAHAQPVVRQWLGDVNKRHAAGEPSSILDHSALMYIMRKTVLDAPPFAADKSQLEKALRYSWQNLTGNVPAELVQRLPWRLLTTARPIERTFASHVFETTMHPQRWTRDPGTWGEYLGILNELRKDYVPQPQDVVAALLMAGLSAWSPYLIGGLVTGLLRSAVGTSILEWNAHFGFGHPPKWFQHFIRTSPLVPEKVRVNFERYWDTHDLHHFKTFKESQFDRFSHPRHEEILVRNMSRKYSPSVVANMKNYLWGTTMGWDASSQYFAAALAFNSAIIAATGGLTIPNFIGAMGGSALLPWGSATQHLSDHERRERALELAPNALQRAYLKTRLARFYAEYHYVHHDNVKDDVNLNLNFGMDLVTGRFRRGGMNVALDMNHHRSL